MRTLVACAAMALFMAGTQPASAEPKKIAAIKEILVPSVPGCPHIEKEFAEHSDDEFSKATFYCQAETDVTNAFGFSAGLSLTCSKGDRVYHMNTTCTLRKGTGKPPTVPVQNVPPQPPAAASPSANQHAP